MKSLVVGMVALAGLAACATSGSPDEQATVDRLGKACSPEVAGVADCRLAAEWRMGKDEWRLNRYFEDPPQPLPPERGGADISDRTE